jgi:hypothetical protein
MANEANNILREFVTQVQQRPEWDQSGREHQMVTAYFTTPHGFDGQVKMSLADWKDEATRNQKLFEAIAVLEGPFWEAPEVEEEEG